MKSNGDNTVPCGRPMSIWNFGDLYLFSSIEETLVFKGKWSLGLMPFGLKSFGLIQLVTWLNFFKLSVSGIGHLA